MPGPAGKSASLAALPALSSRSAWRILNNSNRTAHWFSTVLLSAWEPKKNNGAGLMVSAVVYGLVAQ